MGKLRETLPMKENKVSSLENDRGVLHKKHGGYTEHLMRSSRQNNSGDDGMQN